MHSLLPHPLWVFAPQTTSQGNLPSLAYLKLQLLASLTGAHFLFCISSNYCLHLIFYMGICAQSLQSCLPLCDPMDCSCQTPLSTGFFQAKVLEWVAMPSSGIFPTQGSNLHHPVSPTLQADSLPTEPLGKHYIL